MDLLFRTKKMIEEGSLIETGDSVVAAVSGGIDSVVMLDLLEKISTDIGFVLSVAHINHRLRGAESDGDERFVGGLAKEKGLPFYSAKWSPPSGENIQDAARDFRYRKLAELAVEAGADKIATAHNRDDQAETVILNILRGTALDGLSGMRVSRRLYKDIRLIRPLLGFSRSEIEDHASSEGIQYREDSTNSEPKYTRNFIRHKVMPLLREINPNIAVSVARMADALRRDEDFLKAAAEELFQSLVEDEGANGVRLRLEDFREIQPSIRRRLLKMAYARLNGDQRGLLNDHIVAMERIACGGSGNGAYNLPRGVSFAKRGRALVFLKERGYR